MSEAEIRLRRILAFAVNTYLLKVQNRTYTDHNCNLNCTYRQEHNPRYQVALCDINFWLSSIAG